MMTLKERVFHAVLFEIGAVTVSTVAVLIISPNLGGTALGVSVLMAMIAMVWNFVFNSLCDKIFTAPRETRGLGFRICHTLLFECGLLVASIPMIAHFLQLTLWQAFMADIGLTVLITLYALTFNWLYDNLRVKFVAVSA